MSKYKSRSKGAATAKNPDNSGRIILYRLWRIWLPIGCPKYQASMQDALDDWAMTDIGVIHVAIRESGAR